MTIKKIILCSLIVTMLSSCFGDKKSAIGTDFNDTSFVNKNFKRNKIEFSEISNPCNYVSKKQLANLYNVPIEKVFLIGGNTLNKSCSIRVKLSDGEYDYITGGIRFYEELDEMPDGTLWIETWQLQKGMSKSATWIPSLGKAAFYKSRKRELHIRFNNYVAIVTAPGSAFNEVENAKNRDYKKIALTMANNTPFF